MVVSIWYYFGSWRRALLTSDTLLPYMADIELEPLVYSELHRLAGSYMRGERPGHTLQPTALVHEVYLKLVKEDAPDFEDRSHFMAIAARHMRQILVEHARKRQAGKRGAGARAVSLDDQTLFTPERTPELLFIDEALSELAKFDERKAKIVEMHFFGGMTQEEVAAALGVHVNTVARELRLAQAWLKARLAP